MARKLPGLERVLDVPSLAAVAYGEIASSLYFALGVVALFALGFTPWVLLAVGVLFLLVALSYAEGTSAIPEPGGAATFVRRAFNDPAGFLTGWALILDYLIVMALAGLFVPHYLGHAIGWEALTDEPWDTVVGVARDPRVAALRLVRRTSLYRTAILVAGLALASHLLLVVLGFAFLFSARRAERRRRPRDGAHVERRSPSPCRSAMLAYTGLETVANLAAETREPGTNAPAQPLRRDRLGRRRLLRDRRWSAFRRTRPAGPAVRQRSGRSGYARRSWASPRRSRIRCPRRSRTSSASSSA